MVGIAQFWCFVDCCSSRLVLLFAAVFVFLVWFIWLLFVVLMLFTLCSDLCTSVVCCGCFLGFDFVALVFGIWFSLLFCV